MTDVDYGRSISRKITVGCTNCDPCKVKRSRMFICSHFCRRIRKDVEGRRCISIPSQVSHILDYKTQPHTFVYSLSVFITPSQFTNNSPSLKLQKVSMFERCLLLRSWFHSLQPLNYHSLIFQDNLGSNLRNEIPDVRFIVIDSIAAIYRAESNPVLNHFPYLLFPANINFRII